MSLGLRLGIGGMRLGGADAEEEGLLRLCVQVVAGGFGSLGGNSSVGELVVVGVGDGSKDVKLAWIDVVVVRKQLVPDGLRLMRDGGKSVVDFERVSLRLGRSARKLRFGAAALR